MFDDLEVYTWEYKTDEESALAYKSAIDRLKTSEYGGASLTRLQSPSGSQYWIVLYGPEVDPDIVTGGKPVPNEPQLVAALKQRRIMQALKLLQDGEFENKDRVMTYRHWDDGTERISMPIYPEQGPRRSSDV